MFKWWWYVNKLELGPSENGTPGQHRSHTQEASHNQDMPCLFQNSDFTYVILLVKNFLFEGAGQVVQGTCCYSRDASSDPAHTLDGSQPPVTPAPGQLVLSCSHLGTHTHMVHPEAATWIKSKNKQVNPLCHVSSFSGKFLRLRLSVLGRDPSPITRNLNLHSSKSNVIPSSSREDAGLDFFASSSGSRENRKEHRWV